MRIDSGRDDVVRQASTRVTMRDVAAELGVSTATVSRALAGEDGVSEATKRAVLEACERLEYLPSAVAASLRTMSTGAVGMVVPDITNPFFPAMVQSVEHGLARHGLELMLCDSGNDTAAEERRLQTLLRRRVDAIIVCPVDRTGSAPAIQRVRRQVRILQVDRHALADADFVGVDESLGLDLLVDHLADAGAASAVFIGVTPGISTIEERATAYTLACQRRNIASPAPSAIPFPDIACGRQAAKELLQAGMPAAVVCVNDQVAFGVLRELEAAGVRCPQDVLVTGYDDSDAAALVGLTSVRPPLAEVGEEVVRLLQHPTPAARRLRLAPQLVARATSDPSQGSPSSRIFRGSDDGNA